MDTFFGATFVSSVYPSPAISASRLHEVIFRAGRWDLILAPCEKPPMQKVFHLDALPARAKRKLTASTLCLLCEKETRGLDAVPPPPNATPCSSLPVDTNAAKTDQDARALFDDGDKSNTLRAVFAEYAEELRHVLRRLWIAGEEMTAERCA
jgi:hypothetical protein